MKKLIAILLSLTLTAALVGCDSTPIDETADTTDTPAETGYPGPVQNEAVMYNGYLFMHDNNGFDNPLPTGYDLAGTVQRVDNENIPSEDFVACYLDEGQEIYADSTVADVIYVRYSGGYALFKAESTLDITADVKNLTRTGMTLVLAYTGEPCDAELSTGSQFHLEKYTDGKWTRMETLEPEEEYDWTLIAYLIPCTDDPSIIGEIEIETYWSHMYGSLSDGRYRVVKSIGEFRGIGDVTSHKVYAEFVIDENVE